MKKALKIIVKIVSVIITLLVLIRFISLLDLFGFEFGSISDIGWYIHGWPLGFVGYVLGILLCKKMCDFKNERIIFRTSALFCLFVALFDLLMLGIISQI